MDKLKPVIIGATGAAGQNLVMFLENHPWFGLPALAASGRSAGKKYGEAIAGRSFFEKLPREEIIEEKVLDIDGIDTSQFDIVFSAVPADIAMSAEPRFAKHLPVISTASAFRYEDDVPVLVPGVNSEHAELIKMQKTRRGWSGFISPIPNCTTTGLVVSLRPIRDEFGINSVHMVSMQALSGAGEKGIVKDSEYRKSAEMNVLPYIEKEEEKVIKETKKILGEYSKGKIVDAKMKVGCSCNRAYVENVHTESVFVSTKHSCTVDDVKEAMSSFVGEPQRLNLPSAPQKMIIVAEEADMPQPKLHVERYGRMSTAVGRIREDAVFKNGIVYMLTSDNTGLGAGGGAVLNAEYLKAIGII